MRGGVVTSLVGERALIVRSGLIVGPFDLTGSFTYWALRLGPGGEVLGPVR
jgi:2'-hydroxyisoflavone reductase